MCQRRSDALQLHPVHPDGIVHMHAKMGLKLGPAPQQKRIRAARRDKNPFCGEPQQQQCHYDCKHLPILRSKPQNLTGLAVSVGDTDIPCFVRTGRLYRADDLSGRVRNSISR